MPRLRIGTRASALALWQANTVAAELRARDTDIEIVRITTQGDRRQESTLVDATGKGVFVREIEDALLRQDIDIAVHSAKDMAAEMPAGLAIAAVLPREDPRDALVLPSFRSPTFGDSPRTGGLDSPAFGDSPRTGGPDFSAGLGDSPRIATSSPRRVAQLRALIPGAHFEGIRGNVDTRLRKLDAGEADALILAAAGLKRLGLSQRISSYIPVERCLPAPGQGIVAVQVRAQDSRAYAAVAAMNDAPARIALAAEQAVVIALGGGCQLPLGALAEVRRDEIVVRAVAASLDGRRAVAGEARGISTTLDGARAIGERLAQDLISRGARKILES
jgi:hydroxymethylbilane synthase